MSATGVDEGQDAMEVARERQGTASRGRPVIRRVELHDGALDKLRALLDAGRLWEFCGEYDEQHEVRAIDAAEREHGGGVYQVLDRGAWGRGHWRA
jgi:hypothetical protein